MFSEKNYKLESKEDFAKSHLRVAKDCFQQAKELAESGKEIIPNENPHFRSVENNVIDLLDQAINNLNYAEDFGLRGEKMDDLKKEIHHYLDSYKKRIENKKMNN